MSRDDLAAFRRMRACLAGIVDLDPEGVPQRLAELDREIERLERLLGDEPEPGSGQRTRLEVIPIGAPVKAA
ncbi:hypothetical protein [Enterovirga aerilata]|uniref:Uncharacterized protein n=1 Tax=Enterovirga aerilata TaxID=2730920 RepID=A0A849I937_9HYPH|nr:hypothetical protein [Enterovirga sp. DB1703]NNM72590.1 hypothetical protein [Enterovirga sp. DB1703]